MSINKKAKRIDLDAGDNLYHLKVTTQHRAASFYNVLDFHNQKSMFCFSPCKSLGKDPWALLHMAD